MAAPDKKIVWLSVLECLRDDFSTTSFDLWFSDLELAYLSAKIVVLIGTNDFKCEVVQEKYAEKIAVHFDGFMGSTPRVIIVSREHGEPDIDYIANNPDIPRTPAPAPKVGAAAFGNFPVNNPSASAESGNLKSTGENSAANNVSNESENGVSNESGNSISNESGNGVSYGAYSDINGGGIIGNETAGDGSSVNGSDENRLNAADNYRFDYTFDNFIVGNSNRFAHAACTAVANTPARAYNPLFIYGPSGLGKTHLMYAIKNYIQGAFPSFKLIYIKGEDFTNQLIQSIGHNTTAAFRDRYRGCDVLLIDDIQFIAGRVSTQEEFFHTFNALYEERRQIILTCDRPPRDINTLEDRLKTRFEWGLIADIQPPDLELRVAIIRNKAAQIDLELPVDVLNFLAENLQSNIRQIEGAVRKLNALKFLSGHTISMELARSAVAELSGGKVSVNVTLDNIIGTVSKKYGVTRDDLLSPKRTKHVTTARHICIYLIRNATDMSLPSIGKFFSRDHTTILSSIDVVEKRKTGDPIFEMELNEMQKQIKV